MNVSQLRYLVAVAEHQHFGRAAEACHVSQPTLSTQLKKLEDYLGVVFFERTNKRVSITPIGEQVVARARRALEEIEAIRELTAGHGGPLAGPLRLGIIPTLCPYLLPFMLPGLQARFRALVLKVMEDLTGHLILALQHHQLDCALLALPTEMPELSEIPLFDEPFWVACPSAHPLARADSVGLDALREQTILYVAEGHCLRDQTLAICGEQRHTQAGVSLRPSEDFKSTSLETLRRMVGAGLGFTLLPALAVDDARRHDEDVVCRPFAGDASRRIGLVSRATHPNPGELMLLARNIVDLLPASVEPLPNPS
ncbi:MAG: LysR family transcriptional regulator [Gammaproteobacteria bacterium]|nr:LysR family transcriptional regulator [Gammaproteobacteria bacterium]